MKPTREWQDDKVALRRLAWRRPSNGDGLSREFRRVIGRSHPTSAFLQSGARTTPENPTYRYFKGRLTVGDVGRPEPPAKPPHRPAPAIQTPFRPRHPLERKRHPAATREPRLNSRQLPRKPGPGAPGPKQQKPLESCSQRRPAQEAKPTPTPAQHSRRSQPPPPPASPTHPSQAAPPLLPPGGYSTSGQFMR